MTVLYLTEQGSVVRKEGELFLITKDGSTLQKVPAGRVDQVVIFGNVGLTTPVISHLLQQGTDCVFCNSYGKYHGRLFSTESGFGLLRQKQLQATQDPETRKSVGRDVAAGKLTNQRTLLLRYYRERGDAVLEQAAVGLQVCLERLEKAADLDTIRGLEGQGSALYYMAFKNLLQSDLGFAARTRRPPTDPVNSLLSFGYTVLTYAMQAAVRTVGLDPFLGFLHSVEYSRPSLVLDLIEEFRAIIVDSVVLRTINTRSMGTDDFRQEGRAVLLTQEGMKKFLAHFEERIQTLVMHPTDHVRVTYRRALELQARHLARRVLGQEERYMPFLVR